MGYTDEIEDISELHKKLAIMGEAVFIEDVKKKTLELTGEILSLHVSQIKYEDGIDLSSMRADGQWMLPEIIRLAKLPDNSSRRKVVCMFNQNSLQCFNCFQFLNRENGTEMLVFMRSCDIDKKLPNDLKLFKLLLEIFCAFSDTNPYKITVMFGSLHSYL